MTPHTGDPNVGFDATANVPSGATDNQVFSGTMDVFMIKVLNTLAYLRKLIDSNYDGVADFLRSHTVTGSAAGQVKLTLAARADDTGPNPDFLQVKDTNGEVLGRIKSTGAFAAFAEERVLYSAASEWRCEKAGVATPDKWLSGWMAGVPIRDFADTGGSYALYLSFQLPNKQCRITGAFVDLFIHAGGTGSSCEAGIRIHDVTATATSAPVQLPSSGPVDVLPMAGMLSREVVYAAVFEAAPVVNDGGAVEMALAIYLDPSLPVGGLKFRGAGLKFRPTEY